MASLWEYANPVKFMRLSGWLMPLSAVLAAALIGAGLTYLVKQRQPAGQP